MGRAGPEENAEKAHSLISRALVSHQVSPRHTAYRRALLLLNLTPPILIWLTGGTELWAWLYAVGLHLFLLVGLLHPGSDWLGPILTRLSTDEKIVWLTIDDGPSRDTIALARMLGGCGISATFFVQGKKLAAHAEALAELQRHGHTVANHTENHDLAWFWLYPPRKIAREVDTFQRTAEQMDLPLVPAFRCPAGVKNPFLHSILRSRGLTLTGWTVRAYDGIFCDRERSVRRILGRLQPGAIILVHEGKNDRSGSPASVEMIHNLVLGIQKAGYRFA